MSKNDDDELDIRRSSVADSADILDIIPSAVVKDHRWSGQAGLSWADPAGHNVGRKRRRFMHDPHETLCVRACVQALVLAARATGKQFIYYYHKVQGLSSALRNARLITHAVQWRHRVVMMTDVVA
jgi:hypothetical protein